MSNLSLGPVLLLQPVWLIAACVLALLAWRGSAYVANNNWRRVISPSVFEFLSRQSEQINNANWTLWVAVVVALCLTQPVIRTADDDTWRHSIGWIALVDVSRSMTLDDTVPSRLSAARQALSELSERSGARPIAMVIYSGDAFLVAPPAFDKSVFDEHAALLEHGVLETEGSNLARALSLATSIVTDSGFVAARVFVLTDTGGINANSISAAAYLADIGHTTDVLVFGTSKDSTLATSPTSVSSTLAQELATAGAGDLVFANSFGAIDYDRLSLSEQSNASTHANLKALVWKDQSHWLMLIALPLLLLQFRRERQQ